MMLQKLLLVSCAVTEISAGGHGHWHGEPGEEGAVYHEHSHGEPMMHSDKVDPNYELTNEDFKQMTAEQFWNEALPKLDPSKLEDLIQTLDPEHLQLMLSEMQMPAGHHDDHHLENEDFDDEINPSADQAETVEDPNGEVDNASGEL